MLFSQLKQKAEHLIRGETAEQQACEYLQKQGLKLVARNFRCKQGELDLIMQDKHSLVIVEVRYRDTQTAALESISRAKQLRIITATQLYLKQHNIHSAIRFDVVAVSNSHSINWIKNAFGA